MSKLPFAILLRLMGGRIGAQDVRCPLCSDLFNPAKKVLRVWYDGGDFIRFHCARCGEKGSAKADRTGPQTMRRSLEEIVAFRDAIERREAAYAARQIGKARYLWSVSTALAGSLGETYLRDGRGYGGPLPATLRFLAPTKPDHQPAMIAAFGIPAEPEPGVLALLVPDEIAGVHLTLLAPDGRAKAGTGHDKLMVGSSAGAPIVLAPPSDNLGLIVTEGIEDALSAHQALGLGAWAAGAASRLPTLAETVPNWIDCVTVAVDPDPTGRKHSAALVAALHRRALHVETLDLITETKEAA